MSQLLFVTVPGGLSADGTATLRLLVVPRLDDASMTAAGIAAWPPPQLREPMPVTFTPDVGAPATLDLTPRLRDQDGLWATVFGVATVTAPTPPDPTDTVSVTSTSAQIGAVDLTYSGAAQAYARAFAADPHTALDAYHAAADAALRDPGLSEPPSTHGATPHTAPSGPPTSNPPPPSDVHRIYGMLREYPRVLAALGLLLEFDVPLADVPAGDNGVVRVDWPAATSVTPALPLIVPRSTAYSRADFLARPAPNLTALGENTTPGSAQHDQLNGGLVVMGAGTPWQLAAVDADSAMLRLQAAAAAPIVGPDIARADAPAPTSATLPALRTAGLMLVRAGRQATFARRRARSLANAADTDPILYADDLVLGYRVDVRRFGDTAWNSLCVRQATYRINDVVVGTAGEVEEGHVKAHSAHRTNGQLLADEVVTRWDGWSLAVPRPFPLLVPGTLGSDPGPIDSAALPYRFEADFTVPAGSLPPLRFGPSYQLRARVADIAGGGVTVDLDSDGATAYPFRRFEPVSAPTLVVPGNPDPHADLGPGVHLAQLTITSAGGNPAASTPDPVTSVQMHRGLTRPTVSLTTTEWHGVLDGDPDSTWPIVAGAVAGQPLPDPASAGVAAYVVPEPGGPTGGPVAQNWPAWPTATPTAVELHARAAGSTTPTLSWVGGQLTVSLAPAEDVMVEISSTMAAAEVANFAVGGWSGDAGVGAATTGRHPMLTPPITLHCVHAVRRPLHDPSGALTVQRDPGATAVTLEPTTALLGIDPNSTGQVDVTASWTEVADDVRTEMTDVPVQSLPINIGDTGLARIEHRLHDTRRRDIEYTVIAVSRFHSYFPGSADTDLRATPLTSTVIVPSSARPAPPVVTAVVPAFEWQQTLGPTLTRTRLGNRIRVELGRPWFASGDGERLALVMTPATASVGIPGTTQAGRDPIWETGPCAHWPLAASILGSGDPSAQVLSVGGLPVDVVPAEVYFDESAGRWFADFALAGMAGRSYAPLLRPSLARYQRYSLAGCELSASVLCDFVPLLPDRTLTVSVILGSTYTPAQPTEITVTLSGLGPIGPSANRVDAVVEIQRGAGSDLTIVNDNHYAPAPTGWVAVPVPYGVDTVQSAPLGAPIKLSVPSSNLARYRVRVHEVETTPSAQQETSMNSTFEMGERVVFADTVPLNWGS